MKQKFFFYWILGLIISACSNAPETDHIENTSFLPSWNEGHSKSAIMDFVQRVSDPNHPDFIPKSDRIACFDNDGTLWAEQPLYFQLIFALDYIKKEAPNHPEWKDNELINQLLNGETEKVLSGGEKSILEIIMISHAGKTTEEFTQSVNDWLAHANHPKYNKPFTKMVYQPMLELLDYLRENDFTVFIVSGGGVDFVRTWAEEVYGIPSYQIVGSSLKVVYDMDSNGNPVLKKEANINFIDDGAGKPVGIHQHIGKKPIFSVGNSDGDYQMLEYTKKGPGKGFAMLIHHDDAAREYAYDSTSAIGKLVQGLKAAEGNQWVIVSMQNDWKTIFPF
ncbi:haloacid dehalogenase-like hydrolase [Cyclobacteriaceae bacterium YHN15]|nr:haloacid dehalogenase-like hydrolase [Cyclobacteriaceae bacterium YHN15]